MNTLFTSIIKRLLVCGAAIGLLATGMISSHAQGIGFQLTSGSYTAVMGGTVSGSISMIPVSDSHDNYAGYYAFGYYVNVYTADGYITVWSVHMGGVDESGPYSGYAATAADVEIVGSGISTIYKEVDWPANDDSNKGFSISIPNSGSPGPDLNVTLQVNNYDPYSDDAYHPYWDSANGLLDDPYYTGCEYIYSYYWNTPNTSTLTVLNPNTVMNVEINGSSTLTESESGQSTYIRLYRADTYNTRTVYYSISGNAVDGNDYTAPWSGNIGSVTIYAGESYVDIPVSTLNNIPYSKTLTLTLNSDSIGSYQIGANSSATITFQPYNQTASNDPNNSDNTDMGDAQLFQSATPAFNNVNVSQQKSGSGTASNGVVNSSFTFMNVQATSPYATGLGPTPGVFTITRSGGSNAFTLNYTISGTAIAGSNYVALPVSVQFATNQTSTNLLVNVLTNLPLTSAQTVVLTLNNSSNYFLGYNPQDVVTLLPNSSLTNSVASPAGRYWRGSGSDPTYWSQVIPLDYESGTVYSNLNGNCSTLYPGLSSWNSQTLYHYNATNSLPQTNTANRIAFNNPVVAFGERTGGTPLYFSQPYNFGIYAGDPLLTTTQIVIQVYYRTNDALAGSIKVVPPNYFNTNSMLSYVTNAFQVTTNAFGLSTTLSDSPTLNWGATSLGAYVLTHTANNAATNYYYLVEAFGYPAAGSNAMAIASSGAVAPSLLYTLEFEARPPWRSVFLDQPQFAGSPLPPFYAGDTVAEMLTNTPPVTNVVNFTPSAATNLDDSPELRRHPTLDNFVASMGNDPIALANYVINNIDLTDPMDYSDNGNIAEQSIDPGGVSRGALGTFMEKQGSAVDQCALLVYLLRQAGVPAVYEFAPRNGLQILDARLSQMLKFQVQGAANEAGQLYTTNTMIAVNYPWVAAYIGTNWVHIFPWLKDYEITEGLNLYEYMPTNYSSAYPWVRDYIYGNTNLLSLATNGDNTPRVIFPAYLKQTLLQNHPGVSVDDIGVQILNRQHYYSRWQDFPTPTWLTNVSTPLESLTSSGITNISPTLTNIFDTVSVEIYSVSNPTNAIQTGAMRLVDLHNREFYINQTMTNANQVQLSLILLPFRTNITTQFAFSNDTNLLSEEVLSMTLGTNENQLGVCFQYQRHQALGSAYPIDPSIAFLGYNSSEQVNLERPLWKGDQAAICMDYGRVTQDMLNVHAADIWRMENALQLNPSLTNSVSPDVYKGAAMYLAGMSYYKKVSDFNQVNQNLHKVNILSSWAVGLSKISAGRDSFGTLTNGTDPVLPNVDMFFYEAAYVGNGTVQPDSGVPFELAQQNFNLLSIVNNSAEEHQTINRYYQQTNAVSTVRLLQLSQGSGAGIVPLNFNNYVAQGQTVYQGQALQNWDAGLWSQVANAMQNSPYTIAYITPGPMTNSAYAGMAALILGWNQWQALISPQSLNGAFGQPFPPGTISGVNSDNYSLFNGDDFTLNLTPAASDTTLAPTTTPSPNYANTLTQIQNGQFVLSSYDTLLNNQESAQYNLSTSGTAAQNYGVAYQAGQQSGNVGNVNFALDQQYVGSSDPVQNITGEFHVDETDLQLPGPMPLSLRRNYSSQNLADNQFGAGWKLNIMPYLAIATGGTNIYAADMDGAVLAYVQTSTNASVWLPTLAANPQLNNNTRAGVGGLVNRLRDRLVQTVNGSTTNDTLYGADGSTRVFQVMTFYNGILNQTRPYLQTWTDSRGNYYTFTYGTDSTQPNFGQVIRIQSSNGNYLGLDYDINAHILDAYSGDGRRLTYAYDQYADLTTVTLPDTTTRSYIYQHATQAVTNGTATYSTHLIIEEDKPDGRVLQNAYDSQRRVTNQLSTAGTSLTPIRTASFIFVNNFAFTNSFTNRITGYTLVIDGNSHTNRYDYTNNLITKITDPLGQTIQQTWYPDTTNAPGYPRSLFQVVDKRSMTNQFKYDSNGNVTNIITFGDLTGDGITSQTATNTAIYNANSLPVQTTDPAGNSTVIVYDPVFNFLPQQTIRYAGTTPVSTNFTFYGDATNIVINGSVTQTNLAFGLPTRQIRAYSSAYAATNDFAYNGNGFLTQTIRYSGTGDPNITNTFYYNERGQMVNQVDALGAVTFFDYDPFDRPIEQENFDEFGNALSWSFNYYNDNGELNWVDGPRYNPEDYVFYDYDGAGRRTTEIHWRSEANSTGTGVEAPAGYNLYAQSFYQYDPLGNLTLAVDPRGAMTTNSWDALSHLVQRTHLDTNGVTVLSVEGFGYEPGGQVKYYTNAIGGITTNLYTITGKPEYRRNPDGSTNGWRYYLDGRINKEIQGNGAYWQTTYNDASLITTRIFYSAAGVPEATNSIQLDLRGNVIQAVDAGFNVFTTAFDGLDRVKNTAGPFIQTLTEIGGGMNPATNVTYVTNFVQHAFTNFYDVAGRALTNVNTLGEMNVTLSDAIGRPTESEFFSASSTLVRQTSMTYSADHNSVTTTSGSGAGAIVNTTYTDPDGHNLLSIAYPASGVNEFTLNRYDLAGNLILAQHDSSVSGTVTTWTTTSLAYDGLNRLTSKSDRDNALTTYAYNPMSDLTNRTMPFGLQWRATYNNAGQMLQERNVGGTSGTRTNTYSYFASGNAFAGLLQTKTDGRGVICTYAYDDWLRVITNAYTGSLPEQNLTTSWQYEPRGFITGFTEQFASTNTGPSTSVQRSYYPYGILSSESVSAGSFSYSTKQHYDAANRRSQLAIGSGSYGFGWQADGSLVSANGPTGGGAYTYDTTGLLTSRTVGNRYTIIGSRDGEGRPLFITNMVNAVSALSESLSWLGDGLLASHTLVRSDFTDSRAYSYASLSRRLVQEQLNLNGSTTWTNTMVYDNGVAAGPGALTQMGQASSTADLWNGATDAFSRVSSETNNTFQYAAFGHVNGQSTLSAWLDNQSVAITGEGTNAMQWRAAMELTPGSHQLKVAALHPSGFYTAWATNSFTNSIAYESTVDGFDGAGNITNRIWKNPSGTVERTQTLSWDARGRLHQVVERNASNSGYNWSAVYDPLNRRVQTSIVLVTNGVASTAPPQSINSYFDPLFEFLELGVSYGLTTEWKLYGPDLNGKYGGLNGTGGFDAVSPYLNLFDPVISDFRGNIVAEITNGAVSWNPSRTTGYGAVPDYRPLSFANGADLAQSSAWRGHSVDITGYYNIGLRPFDPISGRWLTYDSDWNERDPNYYSFCGGDPVNGFDSNGKCVDNAPNAINFGIVPVMTTSIETTTYLNDGTVIPPSPNGSLLDPNSVAANSYTVDTKPTGQFQYYVSENPLPANYGLATSTAITTWQIQQQEDLQFLTGTATVLATLATDGLIADGEALAADNAAIRWGPLTGPGPLNDAVANTFRGGSYTESVLSGETTLYRSYGGTAGELGSYWTRTPPAGPLQATMDSALNPAWGNTAQNVSTIVVPRGTTIYEGFAAPQGGLLGGGSQVYIPNVNPNWLVHP
jgi:RHS repeat-associated protein